MVIVIDNASLLIATTYKMGIKGLLYAYWSIITITFFILKKLHGKDLEYCSVKLNNNNKIFISYRYKSTNKNISHEAISRCEYNMI